MTPKVATGLDVLVERGYEPLRGASVGLITNQTGVTSALADAIELLSFQPSFRLAAIFAPEHGVLGSRQAGVHIDDAREPRTGVPVFSLYGSHRAPTSEQLRGIDLLVYDIQDVGSRFYTYLSTLRLAIGAAQSHGIRLIVLDRPNPIGGTKYEGLPTFDEAYRSFVACAPIPIRHSMTVGEFARWVVQNEMPDAEIHVVAMRGWRRSMAFDDTGLPWIAPSPNMPTPRTALVYPGACLIEGTNVSEGRGTTQPFELIGAPWLDPYRLAATLDHRRVPGVRFRPTWFTPTMSKHAAEPCGGVQIHVMDADTFRPVRTGIELICALRAASPEFAFTGSAQRKTFDALMGTSEVRERIESGEDPMDLCDGWQRHERDFSQSAEACCLYG